MDDSPNAPQIWEGALRWRDNTPYKTSLSPFGTDLYIPMIFGEFSALIKR